MTENKIKSEKKLTPDSGSTLYLKGDSFDRDWKPILS